MAPAADVHVGGVLEPDVRGRTSFTDQTSGCSSSASGGLLRMRRSRHRAAFLRTMGRTAPLVCTCLRQCACSGTSGAQEGWRGPLTSRFMTSTVSSAAISAPPTASRQRVRLVVQQADAAGSGRPTIPDEAQGQALEGLVAGDEVVAYGVDDEPQELVYLHDRPA